MIQDRQDELLQQRISEVDREILDTLQKIYQKSFQDLTDDELGFLRARMSYVDPVNRERYESLLKPTQDLKVIKPKAKPAIADGKPNDTTPETN